MERQVDDSGRHMQQNRHIGQIVLRKTAGFCLAGWLLPAKAEFPHPGTQRTGIEAKQLGGPLGALDPPSGRLEDLEDMVAFQVGEGLDFLTGWPQ